MPGRNRVVLYRIMSDEEYRVLREKGFWDTFRRRWKYFTLDPEYIGIIIDEIDYGLWKEKYKVPCRFVATFKLPLEELERRGLVKVYRERGYTTVALSIASLGYIDSIRWERLDPQKIPRPEPLVEWVSKAGRVCRVYRIDKALRVLRTTSPSRIRYVSPRIMEHLERRSVSHGC